jgi:probable F420-dependent oxidoreductase
LSDGSVIEAAMAGATTPRRKRLAMGIPLQGIPLHEQREWIVEIAALGYDDVWTSEAYNVDGFTPLVLASQWAPSLRLGCACHPVQTRGPGVLAQSAAGLAQAAPGRFVLGIGASSPTVVENWNAVPYDKPYQRMRDGLKFLHAALAGEKVDATYETFGVSRFQLTTPLDPPPPIFAAALRPQMLRLAGKSADGVLLNWIGANDVDQVLETVADGGRDAAGRDIESVLRLIVIPHEDIETARVNARYAITGTLTVPAYRAHQEWLGRGDVLAAMWEEWDDGNRKAALAAIPNELVDDLIVVGPVERCRERIERFFEAGIDTIILEVGVPASDAAQIARDLAPRS